MDRESFARTEPAEQVVQIVAGIFVRPALVGDRQAANRFDDLERLLAVIVAYGFAEYSTEKPDVLMQRAVSVFAQMSISLRDRGHDSLHASSLVARGNDAQSVPYCTA
jgi:hypothetical protein